MNFDPQGNFIDRKQYAGEAAKAFVKQVYAWMVGALLVTAAIAYAFASSGLIGSLFDLTTGKPTGLYWGVVFSPVIIVLVMGMGFEKLSFWAMAGLFTLYSILIGISLSTVFFVFEPMAIFKAFGITAGTFGIMAIAGYTTKADLSRFGAILTMGLIGVVIAMVVNAFTHSSQLSWIIDIVCVIVFTGLVAWKMQMIRQMGEEYGTSQPKMAVWMALSLYITFINLFMTILRLMNGNRR